MEHYRDQQTHPLTIRYIASSLLLLETLVMAVILVWASPALRSSSKGQRHGRYAQGQRYPRARGDAPDGEDQRGQRGQRGQEDNGVLQVADIELEWLNYFLCFHYSHI